MSIAPENTEKPFEISRFDRVTNVIRRAFTRYFEKPVKHIFYVFLTLLLIALLFGREIAWQYYAILILLAGKEYNLFSFAKKLGKKVWKKKM